MLEQGTAAEHRSPPKVRFQPGFLRDQFTASFEPGVKLQVTRGRLRCYPGLPGPAPDTRACYQLLGEHLPAGSVLWDYGCGAGAGLVALTATRRVIGIDRDEEALRFARRLVPGAEFVLARADQWQQLPAPDMVAVIDVLGMIADPERQLFELRRRCGPARLLLAEPLAAPAQTLLPPMRTAFSPRSLEALLIRSGFEVERWLEQNTFVSCIARPADDSVARAFQLALAPEPSIEEAVAALEALAEHPRMAVRCEAWLALAELFTELQSADRASSAYLAVLEQAPNHPLALAGLSQLLLLNRETSEAVQLARNALRADPTSPEAACSAALAMGEQNPEASLEAWTLAATLVPANPEVVCAFAQTAVRVNRFELAVDAFERLRGYDIPWTADYHVTLAWLLVQLGKGADAVFEARLAQSIDPNHPLLDELLGHLKLPRNPISGPP